MSFCEDCGAKLEEGQVCDCKQKTGQQPENQQPQNQQPVYQQQAYQQPVYQQPTQYNNQTKLEEPMTVGEWIVTLLLMCIPCANIILAFVWAFSSSEKKSKSNFFKAYLIMMLVVLVIYIVFIIIFGAAFFSAFSRSSKIYY